MTFRNARSPILASGLLLLLPAAARAEEPRFGDAFWDHWGDGRAELAGYDLTYPRYGELRQGTAVTIFVTEPFLRDERVKAEGGAPADETFQVMKLNLVQDFPTGVYDYNLMRSAFLALEPAAGRPPGRLTKAAFSSQEWCGQVYHQLRFHADAIREDLHSYFAGEADQRNELPAKEAGLSADALPFWARGFAGPVLEAGESRQTPILRSLAHARLRHEPVKWGRATLSRGERTRTIEVPAGRFTVRVMEAALEDGPDWTFYVEDAAPHRLIRWESDAGHEAELLASDRMKYWRMNGAGHRGALQRLGLSPRAERRP